MLTSLEYVRLGGLAACKGRSCCVRSRPAENVTRIA